MSIQEQVEELQQQQRIIREKIEQLKANHRAEGIEKAIEILKHYELTPHDLIAHIGKKPNVVKDKSPANSLKGQTIQAKYRNVATGETWSGRGLKPKWLTLEIEKGRSLNDFLVSN